MKLECRAFLKIAQTKMFTKLNLRQGARNLRAANRFVPPPLAAWIYLSDKGST